jgi:hypothetical protein
MDETIDQLVVSVRADTAGFARDVATMRGQLEGPLSDGASRAGRTIDNALARAIASGKLGFDDLKKVALSAMEQIAQASLRSLFGSNSSGGGLGGSLVSGLSSAISSLFGAPGRATGGPVSAGRAYLVGERGPELFVPSGNGRIEHTGGGSRDVRVGITISSPAPQDPQVLRQSSRQVARAIKSALAEGQ